MYSIALKPLKQRLFAIILAVLTFMTVLSLSTPHRSSIDALYVFGDSLSDMGTVYRATGGMYPPNPPYFQGRYSNGRVWVEYLADRLHLAANQIHNFACGGATTGRDANTLVPGLLPQVQSFIQTQTQVNRDGLYVVWAGANDYLQGVSNPAIPLGNVTQSIASLVDAGAEKILVANLPNLGELPVTRTSTNSTTLNALTQTHNRELRRSLKALNQHRPELHIKLLDTNALYKDATSSPAKFGFTNVTHACTSTSSVCSAPDQFLFWDSIHPTTTAHEILGDAAFSVLGNESISPAPSS